MTNWIEGTKKPENAGNYWLCMRAKQDFPESTIRKDEIHIVEGEFDGYVLHDDSSCGHCGILPDCGDWNMRQWHYMYLFNGSFFASMSAGAGVLGKYGFALAFAVFSLLNLYLWGANR